jgi:hypothetical protein
LVPLRCSCPPSRPQGEAPAALARLLGARARACLPDSARPRAPPPAAGEAIDAFLSYLAPANLNVFWSGKQHASEAQQHERWYGARYSSGPLPQELLDAIAAACGGSGACSDGHCPPADGSGSSSAQPAGAAGAALDMAAIRQHLRLPDPNWAIPADLSLRPPPPPAPASSGPDAPGPSPASSGGRPVWVRPGVACETPSSRLWHHQDTTFGIPKAHLHWHLVSPQVYAGPQSLICARLLVGIRRRRPRLPSLAVNVGGWPQPSPSCCPCTCGQSGQQGGCR